MTPDKMKTYECRIEGYFEDGRALISNHPGRTAAAARYAFWRDRSDLLRSYRECFPHIKSRCVGELKPEHYFQDANMFNRVCESRAVPNLRLGMVVDVAGKMGHIVGANCHNNLDVLFGSSVSNVHPTWETTYYDGDKIVYDFKNKKK